MLQYFVWLASLPGLGSRKKQQLLAAFGTPELLFYASRVELAALDCLRRDQIDLMLERDLTPARRILDDCAEKGIGILPCSDTLYSQKLRSIDDAPVVLYYQGVMQPVDTRPSIAVVGTRDATDYGLLHAKRFGYQLAKGGAIVVSGCALGIDTVAMKGALTGGGPVIGVLGGGIDRLYPPQNAELFEDIRHYGCLISAYPPGTPPKREHFPRRNRLISGLSDGVAVMEAPARSGAMITARYAAEQGRDVFALPGSVDAAGSAGPHQLIRDGAALVEDGTQILASYAQQYRIVWQESGLHPIGLHPDEAASPKKITKTAAFAPEKDKIDVDNEPSRDYIDVNMILQELDAGQQKIVLALQDGPQVPEVLAQTLGLAPQDLLADLTLLQISGYVVRMPDGQFCLAAKTT